MNFSTFNADDTEIVIITRILGNGLLVKHSNKTDKGFIPSREFTWDNSIFKDDIEFRIGQRLEVVFVKFDIKHDTNIYSIRLAKENPWKSKARLLRKGMNIIVEVTGIINTGIFAQISSGIIGRISPSEIPRGKDHPDLSEIIRLGDKLFVDIINIDLEQQYIDLSIISPLEKMDNRQASLIKEFTYLFQKNEDTKLTSIVKKENAFFPKLPKIENILIVDDEKVFLSSIEKWLKTAFSDKIKIVKKGQNEIEAFRILNDFSPDLIIMDLGLRETLGLKLANKIYQKKPFINFLFTSSNPFGQLDVDEYFSGMFPFCEKEKDELVLYISKWLLGILKIPFSSSSLDKHNLLEDIGFSVDEEDIGLKKIRTFITEIRLQSDATNIFLLEVDDLNRSVNFLLTEPKLNPNIVELISKNLYFSPIKEIISRRTVIFENFLNRKNINQAKYRYFFPALSFNSFIGIPLKVPGKPIEHILLLLFNRSIVKNVHELTTKAHLIQTYLEKIHLNKMVQKFSSSYFKGQFFNTLGHELNNKIPGIDRTIKRLNKTIEELNNIDSIENKSSSIEKINRNLVALEKGYNKLKGIINSYRALAKEKYETVKLDPIIHEVIEQLKPTARDTDGHSAVQIEYDNGDKDLEVICIRERFEQVLLNVVLNAIQQTNIQDVIHFQRETNTHKKSLFSKKIVIIKTRISTDGKMCQVFIIDSGPGIHSTDKEKIFYPEFSNRGEGQGLGLYISRNLMHSMKGNLEILDTVLYFGSAFRIEIPLEKKLNE